MEPNLVKAVVDIEKETIAIDAALHIDLRDVLVENGSEYKNLWGINLYPDNSGDELVEFDSMINIRPPINRSRGVEDENIRVKILEIVKKWIK
uniref:Uncharacterized protein n=1 Tax=candidate division CPR3 bacterium TaxID=2268181 RepID=A0A7C4R689_UNCC3